MQVCQSMVQVKFIVWYCHLIVILFLILISPKSLKLTTPGELNCTEDRIHSHTSSLQWKLRQCLEMRRAWNADQWHLVCWMTVSSLDPQLQSVYRDSTSNLSFFGSFVWYFLALWHNKCLTWNSYLAKSPYINISTSILCLKACKRSQVSICPREPITK